MTDLSDLAAPTAWADLGVLLHDWAVDQRWFGGKARESVATEIADTCLLPALDDGSEVLVVLLAVDYGRGHREHYHLPLVRHTDTAAAIGAVAHVPVGDATADAAGARTLAAAALTDRGWPTTLGSHLRGKPLARERLAGTDTVRWLTGEQSNSSAVLGDRLFLKVFRRLEGGPNPDVELTGALTEAGFDAVPPQAGSLRWGDEPDAASDLVLLTGFVHDSDDAWQQALADADAVAEGRPPPHGVAEAIDELGRVVADLHHLLATRLGADLVGRETLASWAHTTEAQLERVLELASGSQHPGVAAVAGHEEALRSRLADLARLRDAGAACRIHGDLHLGQLLRRHDGAWLVLDFEGEPARALSERRRLHSPMRDVAGMVRSFDYAACHRVVRAGQAQPPPLLADWRARLTEAFVAAYESQASAELLPADPDSRRTLREAFVLDKAIYELGYELDNRPDWVGIPAAGILRVLGAPPPTPDAR